LCVPDSGIGISAEVLPHIFDLFTQADNSLARSEGGLGIGLTIVKRIAEIHGGRIEAYSEGSGHGSEFMEEGPESRPNIVILDLGLQEMDGYEITRRLLQN
jgi:signal transduction histidine kinase